MVPELTRSSVAEMINGIADCARRRGYLLRLFVNNNRGQEAPIESEKELWGDVIASGVDGVLYINDELTNEHLELIMEASVDVVLTNTICNDPGVPSVSIDYVKAAYDITKEMIARGNKKIWMITSIRKYMVNDLKVQGYNKAMQEAGLEPKVIPVSGKTELTKPPTGKSFLKAIRKWQLLSATRWRYHLSILPGRSASGFRISCKSSVSKIPGMLYCRGQNLPASIPRFMNWAKRP